MNNQLHNELKKEFQLERMILFSDAVFAIAITLLVIEIKVPDIEPEHLNETVLLQNLAKLIPKFFGFIVSFMLIGQYWTVHHRLFGFVTNYTQKLLWLNMWFLFAIALMPFSTAFYSEYVMKHVITPVIFYAGNIVLLGLFNLLLWRYISKPANHLSEGLTPLSARYFSLRAIAIPSIFTVFAFAYLVEPRVAVYIPMLIPVIMRLTFKKMKKKVLAQAIPQN
jgi:uncharacterized membrane protein